MVYETVIGLEIHAELKTKTKIFCSCSTEFGKKPNENTCPICLGIPGTLPVLNEDVINKNVDKLKFLFNQCKIVKNRFFDNDKVICAPAFETPIEAKSYIANMDIFVGARMHATIGAVSAGVATIPFAYSKKFKTMFGNLDYKYVIEARNMDTDAALKQTKDWIVNYNELEKASLKAREKTRDKLNLLKKEISVFVNK